MAISSWLKWSKRGRGPVQHRRPEQIPAPRSRFIPRLDVLEDRAVPATLVVNTANDNTTDDAVLTLREAVLLVNAGGDAAALGRALSAGEIAQLNTASPFGSNDAITFAPRVRGTITLAPRWAS